MIAIYFRAYRRRLEVVSLYLESVYNSLYFLVSSRVVPLLLRYLLREESNRFLNYATLRRLARLF
jgi:hypothetical protein